VAAHGVHQPENPLFSSIRMVDGPVFAHELEQAARAPEHVVLSACEVGLATIRPGDEPLGLASVLLHLGTRSVVAGSRESAIRSPRRPWPATTPSSRPDSTRRSR
jgi:CHAT domain-containing protein